VAMIDEPVIQALDADITAGWVERGEDALLLERIGNANNFGAIVRSAAFFGIRNIVVTFDESQSSVTTSSYRVAQGGMEFVRIYSVRSVPRLLQAVSGKMERIGTDVTARLPVSEIRKKCAGKPAIIVLGNEESGISTEAKENCDELVIIPFAGMNSGASEAPVESLNVAQAAAVLLYECRKN